MNLIIRNIIEITYVEQVFDKFSHRKVLVKVLGLVTVWIQGCLNVSIQLKSTSISFN